MLEDFLDIISDAKKLNNKRTSKSINIKIFSNSIINPIDQIIKYYFKKKVKTFFNSNIHKDK